MVRAGVVHLGFRLEVEPLHPITEGMTADLELISSALKVELVAGQCGLDHPPFVGSQKCVERAVHGFLRRSVGARQPLFDGEVGEVAGLKLGRGFKDQGAFDGVAQLAHVARPGVFGQTAFRRRAEAAPGH